MFREALRVAFLGSRLARACSGWLVVVLLGALLGPTLSSWEANSIDWDALEQAPDLRHWFGTDLIGRDLFTRIMLGGRISLGVAIVATLVSVLIGVPVGAISGYLGGKTDQILMRVVDALYALPFILIVILLVVVVGRNPFLLFMALGAVFWLDIARIVRGQALRVREAGYIAAARSLGSSQFRIVLRHLIPNVSGPALIYATLTVPGVILAESFISFLGLGIQEPDTSWGVLIADGTANMESAPWALFFPALALGLTVWSLNMLGDRLRDAFDIRTRGYTPRLPRIGSAA